MAIKIKSAVLSASSLNVEYEEIVATPDSVVTHDFKQKRGTLIHEDLANAINALKPHFAMLCEFREVKPDPIEMGVESIESWDFGDLLDKVFVSVASTPSTLLSTCRLRLYQATRYNIPM